MTSADQPAPGQHENAQGGTGSPGPVAGRDAAAVELQLGRSPRGLRGVAHRCPCGLPDVVRTAPRLESGEPFPTLYYLTCPRAASAIGRLENEGRMRRMQERLGEDAGLRDAYTAAHESYLAQRAEQARLDGVEPLPEGMQSTGGMPTRVKCLHALVAHELAVPGVNPFGAQALEELPNWWDRGPCVCVEDGAPAGDGGDVS
ncbi:DUF501 domain-containing protein [Nocardiopsis sp. CNT312]|uniref:DUF501 domain-containing protein n=1 Tax=Nocardiopsis sp. CNT312 TaxID=1137268 RepID=UPI0004BB1232|nr:DUF501 domain-containing protein [Nocardiopsis sp. CNT312]